MMRLGKTRIAIGALALALLGTVVAASVLRSMVWDALRPRTLSDPEVPEGLVSISATSCGGCHAEIHAEWRASRMGRAMENPAFLADWAANGHMPPCLSCHAPFQAQQPDVVTGVASVLPELSFEATPNASFDAAFQREGVTCMACHRTAGGAIAGVHAEARAPHAVSIDPRLTTGEVCTRCHEMVNSPLFDLARPVIDTVGEHEAWRAESGGTETCVHCHMTAVERPSVSGGATRSRRRHDFHGGWDEETLRLAIALGALRRESTTLTIDVVNRTGHRFPTGETSVAVDVEISALDSDGLALDTATTRLTRVVEGPRFHDVMDTTLRPSETRALTANFSPEVLAAATGGRAVVRYERYANLPDIRREAGQLGLVTSLEIAVVETSW